MEKPDSPTVDDLRGETRIDPMGQKQHQLFSVAANLPVVHAGVPDP